MKHAEFKARILAFAPGATADAVAAFAISLANAGVDPDRAHWPEGFLARAEDRAEKARQCATRMEGK